MILSVSGDNEKLNRYTKKIKKQFTQGDISRAIYDNVKVHHSKIFKKKIFLDDVRNWFLDTN